MRTITGHGDPAVQHAFALLLVVLPLAPALVPLAVIVLALAVIRLRWRSAGAPWRLERGDGSLPLMAAYYALHVVGMAWTTNVAFGAFDLEVKAAFVLFPVLAVVVPTRPALDARPLLTVFVLANAVAAWLCMLLAVWSIAAEHLHPQAGASAVGLGHLFESRFAHFLHPSYMALYSVFALATWMFSGAWRQAGRWGHVAVVPPLTAAVVLSNSKMGWITLVVVLLHGAWHFRRERKIRRALVGGLLAGSLGFAALFATARPVRLKVLQAFEATQGFDPASDRSSDLRRMTWSVGLDLLRAHPITGVGTGDIKDELHAESARRGYVHVVDKRLNAHSQFVQSGIALGWPGLVLCAAMLLVPLLMAVRWRRPVVAAFVYLVLLNATVESLLEVQAGVVFLAAFAFLFHRTHAPDPVQSAAHR